MKLRPSVRGLPVLLGLMMPALAACGQGQAEKAEDAAPPPAAAAPETAPSPTVAASPAPPPAAAALRSSPGPRGSTVDLTRVQVTGSILTVELRYTPPPGEAVSQWFFNISDVSVIDDATSQRYGVLQDEEKKWMAAPLSGGRIGVSTGRDKPAIIWFKFPAPPADSATISLNMPDVSPFDGVPVQR